MGLMNEENELGSIRETFESMGIVGYYFALHVNTSERNVDVSSKVISKVTLANRIGKKIDLDMIYFSDQKVKNCFHIFRQQFVDSDAAFAEMSKMKVKTKVFKDNQPTTAKQHKWYEVMQRYGYGARGVSIFELKRTKPLLGVLVVYSDRAPEELEKIVHDSPLFSQTAERLADVITLDINGKVNPWVSLGGISTNSHNVLRHLADGLDTHDIAKAMSLTRRGVDYHIETMKDLLQAKNRTHLIAKALREGVIN